MSLLILGFFTFLLILGSAFLLLIILMQKASSNAGMGATLGGGAAESALGGGASNVLTKGTIWGIVFFFVVAFGLYLGHMRVYVSEADRGPAVPSLRGIEGEVLPSLTDFEDVAPAAETPAAPAANTAAPASAAQPAAIDTDAVGQEAAE